MAAVYLFAIQQLNKTAPSKMVPVSDRVSEVVDVNTDDKMKKLLDIQQMDMDERMKVRTQMINSDIARASEIPPLNKANDLKTPTASSTLAKDSLHQEECIEEDYYSESIKSCDSIKSCESITSCNSSPEFGAEKSDRVVGIGSLEEFSITGSSDQCFE